MYKNIDLCTFCLMWHRYNKLIGSLHITLHVTHCSKIRNSVICVFSVSSVNLRCVAKSDKFLCFRYFYFMSYVFAPAFLHALVLITATFCGVYLYSEHFYACSFSFLRHFMLYAFVSATFTCTRHLRIYVYGCVPLSSTRLRPALSIVTDAL